MSETVSENSSSGIGLPSFSKKTKIIAAVSIVTLLAGGVVAQTAGAKAVSLGSNGIEINTGQLDMNGNDIVSDATTVWDASTGKLSNNTIPSINHDTLSNVSSSQHHEKTVDTTIASESCLYCVAIGEEVDNDLQQYLDVGSYDLRFANYPSQYLSATNQDIGNVEGNNPRDLILQSGDDLIFSVDEGAEQCTISEGGDLSCPGSKNWVHTLNETHEAVYTAQESPEVRAVYEGQTLVDNGKATVDLPNHFEKTVSDTRPSLRVQATPHELATVAVTERSDSSLTIEATKDVAVDYRVTGIREGYEDKQVVREKEDQ